jgi:2-polyprenyl-3-methyl-5-hydroxy-6-metoxy-1,4-benzoquinol methylase
MSRINGTRETINADQVAAFFERRAEKFDAENPLCAVLYQDQAPHIAQERDAFERERILPLLDLSGTQRVLDIGCGIGRWATSIHDRISKYYGIDASSQLIDIAKTYCPYANVAFEALATAELDDAWFADKGPFDCVIFSGILIYLNDEEIEPLLSLVSRHTADNGVVYFREPMGVMTRLTLSGHWSEELQSNYSAIYRTSEELLACFRKAFPASEFTIGPFEPLFENANLNNRTETRQMFCLVKKTGVSS